MAKSAFKLVDFGVKIQETFHQSRTDLFWRIEQVTDFLTETKGQIAQIQNRNAVTSRKRNAGIFMDQFNNKIFANNNGNRTTILTIVTMHTKQIQTHKNSGNPKKEQPIRPSFIITVLFRGKKAKNMQFPCKNIFAKCCQFSVT